MQGGGEECLLDICYGVWYTTPQFVNISSWRTELTLKPEKEFLFDTFIEGDPLATLTQDQKEVLSMVSYEGSGTYYIRDRAIRMKITDHLSVIKTLFGLGLVEMSRDKCGDPILVRIR